MSRRLWHLATASFIVLSIARAAAQSPAAGTSPNSAVVFGGRDAAILGGASLGAAVLSLFDVKIARTFADSALHANHELQAWAKNSSHATETVLMISGGAAWAVSRLGHADGAADVALHTTESVAAGAAFIQAIRGIAGRARPYVVDDAGENHDSDPYEFDWLKGFTSFNYRSFPSMHAMANYAAATALVEEMRVRHTRGRRLISPLLYVSASIAPAARMYLDEHWASDIALGALLGVYSAQKVVFYSHAHPNNPIDRKFLRPEANIGVTIGVKGASLWISPF